MEQVTFGTVHLVPLAGSGAPEILGIHTARPVPRWMPEWKADLTLSRALVEAGNSDVIVAGDLNATLRHGSLGGITTHVDATSSIHAASRGTWPHAAPRVLRSSIDHILVPVTGHSIKHAKIVDVPRSDHAAIAATIVTNA